MRRASVALLVAACAPPEDAESPADDPPSVRDAEGSEDVEDTVTLVTFNVGSGANALSDPGPDDFRASDFAYADDQLGNGLAWTPAVQAVQAWLARVQPDVVGLQELLVDADCATLPEPPPFPSACDGYDPAAPPLAARLLGPAWQVACHPGKPDECIGVRRAFGALVGCTDDGCADALRGAVIEGCGRGARVAAGVVARPDGASLTVVHVHGSSGLTADDQACRVRQFEAVFVDAGDGTPLASGDRVVVLGDLNTDPGRFVDADVSAARWVELVGADPAWTYLTEVGPDALRTYGPGLASIDHVLGNALDGACVVPGLTPGEPAVLDTPYFDHRPAWCTATWR